MKVDRRVRMDRQYRVRVDRRHKHHLSPQEEDSRINTMMARWAGSSRL